MSGPILDALRGELSGQQQAALDLADSGVMLAGAGAGKTKTLVNVVARDLIVDGIEPERIVLCTFTRAAAQELISRLAAKVGEMMPGRQPNLDRLWIGTIDSLCSRLLRENALTAGVSPTFDVGDERVLAPLRRRALEDALAVLTPDERALLAEGAADQIAAVAGAAEKRRIAEAITGRRAGFDAGPDLAALEVELAAFVADPKVATGKTSSAKNARAALGQLRARRFADLKLSWGHLKIDGRAELVEQLHLARSAHYLAPASGVVERYGARFAELKQTAGVFDFADITLRAYAYLREQRGVEGWRGWTRVYVDEAQDTNELQLSLLELMRDPTDGARVLCGDAAQSIYSFRQADVEQFRRQRGKLDPSQVVQLSRNYRSTPEILTLVNAGFGAHALVSSDLVRMTPRASNPVPAAGDPACELLLVGRETGERPNAAEEARHAVPAILARHHELDLPWDELCVLARNNTDARAYAAEIRRLGVPVVLLSRKGLTEQDEVRDLVAYLTLLAGAPLDTAALLRVLSSPFAQLDAAQIGVVFSAPDGHWERLTALAPEWVAEHRAVRRTLAAHGVAAALRVAVQRHGLDLALDAHDPTGMLGRNVEKFVAQVAQIERVHEGPSVRAVCDRVLSEIEMGEAGEGQSAQVPATLRAVKVMSIHNSKGMEFPHVAAVRLTAKGSGGRDGSLFCAADGRLGWKFSDKVRSSVEAAAIEHEQAVSEAEEARLLYVALTRAERRLTIVSARGKTAPPTATKLLLEAFGVPVKHDEPAPERVELEDDGRLATLAVRALDADAEPPCFDADAPAGASGEAAAGDEGVIEPPAPARLPEPMSYTALTTWRRCGLRRHLERDHGLQGDQRSANVESSAGRRRFGVGVHQALRRADWLEADLRTLKLPDVLEGEPVTWSRADVNAAACLFARLEASPLRARLRDATRVETERPFTVMLGGQRVQGAIDVWAQLPDGVLIADWKAGADEDGVFSEDYELQRRLYALAALADAERPERVLSMTHYLSNGRTETLTVTREQFAQGAGELADEVRRVLTAPVTAAAITEQGFCQGCPGRQLLCPVSLAAPPAAEG